MNHADELDILKHYQHGFQKGHSCESQLFITVEDIGRQLDQQYQVDILILDFAKAFDMVQHKRLLTKLKYYGVRGRSLNWIQSWLIQRHQTVIVDGKNSRHVPVKSGVPQGSILGPLLLLIYINDIGDNITSSLRHFTDDCLLYRRTDTENDTMNLQRDPDNIVK